MRSQLFLLLLIISPIFSQNDPGEDDHMDTVPGYGDDAPRVFTNFLTPESSNSSFHYILIEGKAGKDNNLPLTVWFNGGPGCSSKVGFLQEIGPFYLPAGTHYNSSTTLKINTHSWNTLSNLLFIDSPPGVGYSKTSNSSYTYNDQNTAQQTLNALIYFITKKFPSYTKKDVYLVGEYYAGKLIPDLALRINAYNLNAENKIFLKGILIGNGIMDFSDGTLEQNQIDFMISHNFIDPTLEKYWITSCQTDPQSAGCAFFFKRYDDLLAQVNLQNIYGKCYQTSANQMVRFASKQSEKVQFVQMFKKCQFYEGIQDYFRLNVNTFRASNDQFVVCNQKIYESYKKTEAGSMNEYSRLISETGIKIMFYGGDWDDLVPFKSTISNIERLGMRQQGTLRHWTNSKQQHIGFKRTFELGQREIKFWVIKGAGHQTPLHKREVTYDLFNSFIQGTS